ASSLQPSVFSVCSRAAIRCRRACRLSSGLGILDFLAALTISRRLMSKLLFPEAGVPRGRPRDLDFQICTSSDIPPEGDGWLHQLKHYGWRVFVGRCRRRPASPSRNSYDYTHEFIIHFIVILA